MQIPWFNQPIGRKGTCVKCSQQFVVGAGLSNHQKSCKGGGSSSSVRHAEEAEEAEEAAAVELAGAVGEQAGPAVATVSPEGNEVEEPDVRGNGTAPVNGAHPKRLKPKKGGGYKVSGLRDGDKKGSARTIHFKYEVVQHLRLLQARKAQGLCDFPNDETAFRYGVAKGQVSAWQKQESSFRQALQHGTVLQGRGKSKRDYEKLVPFTCVSARKAALHPGRKRKFAAAEEEVMAIYREKRRKGLRISGYFLRITMKRIVQQHYGTDVSFKASSCWLSLFARHFSISLRRKTNKKHLSVEERMPKCQRWHARFRRRLKGGKPEKLHPKWGRWLPEDRLSIDQVPCNLREGDGRTYADTGEKRVWLAGSKADCGKRFCTLQVAARCANGDPTKPRHGQPKLTIVFRGQGAAVHFVSFSSLLHSSSSAIFSSLSVIISSLSLIMLV